MILLDTSGLIDALCEPRRSFEKLRALVASGEKIAIPSIVLYEWLRGPRNHEELIDQEVLVPAAQAATFGSAEAAIAADLYKRLKRARGREFDLAIAATALVRDAPLWTLNPEDFKDIPGLRLV